MTDEGDALDRVAVPRLGLSAAVLIAIALGGALGTVARFLLDTAFSDSARHFPTTTLLINLSGSLAIGLLIPLVDNFATDGELRCSARFSSSAYSAAGPRTPHWPSMPSSWPRTATPPPACSPWWPRSSEGWRWWRAGTPWAAGPWRTGRRVPE